MKSKKSIRGAFSTPPSHLSFMLLTMPIQHVGNSRPFVLFQVCEKNYVDLTCSRVNNVIGGGGRQSKSQGEDGRGRHLDVKLHHDAWSLTRHERMSTAAVLHISSISAPQMTRRRRHWCQCPSYSQRENAAK